MTEKVENCCGSGQNPVQQRRVKGGRVPLEKTLQLNKILQLESKIVCFKCLIICRKIQCKKAGQKKSFFRTKKTGLFYPWSSKNSIFYPSTAICLRVKLLKNTVDSGYKGMLNRGNSGYRGQFAADQNFYLVKAGQIEEKGAF